MREVTSLEQVAEHYSSAGYSISVQPSFSDDSPLAGLRADLLAIRGDEHILIDVRSADALDNPASYQRIVERVEEVPGWRFELFLLGEPDDGPRDSGVDLRTDDDLRDDAHRLASIGEAAAGLVLASAALEVVLRRLAVRLDNSRKVRPVDIAAGLASRGLISRTSYFEIRELFTARDAIVHGREERGRADVGRALSTALGHIDALTELGRDGAVRHQEEREPMRGPHAQPSADPRYGGPLAELSQRQRDALVAAAEEQGWTVQTVLDLEHKGRAALALPAVRRFSLATMEDWLRFAKTIGRA